MYATQWRSVKELSSVANVRGLSGEFISFQSTRAPCSNFLTHLQTPSTFCSTKTYLTFEQNEHQIINNIPGFPLEFPYKIDPEDIVFSQSNYGDNFNNTIILNESFWATNEDNFNYVQFQGLNMPLYDVNFSADSKLPEENHTTAVTVGEQPSFSVQTNQDNNHDKHSSGPREVGGVSSSSSSFVSRTASKGTKRRKRWTKDLHEPFISIVDRLGGPQKAKPKQILRMTGSGELTVSQIKSHLQKYRSTMCMQRALQGDSRMQIEESWQLQLQVERSLQEQLKMQRNMQVLIEQQKKQLIVMLECQKLNTKCAKSQSQNRSL